QTSVEIHVMQGERQMAADNKTLGRFVLDGIPPAPRGAPQVEVSFDIDSNGIVNVSAKDLGTGKEQSITIKATTSLSDDEIDKMVKDSERFAEEDKKRRELVDARNSADSTVYSTEKTLKDLEEQVSAEEREEIEKAMEKVKEAAKGEDVKVINDAVEELTKHLHDLSIKMYEKVKQEQQAADGAQQTAGGEEGAPPEDDVVDADFEEVE
ncbi:MAG: Hsp70 family protein, partial [Candidatus Contubernalis sp.]|nr:Hsp70 family protein [Candidatus Contubernalis sp.]